MCSMKKVSFQTLAALIFISTPSFSAPQYKVSMLVGLKGQSPISVNTVAKSGKKNFISHFSDDGNTETLIEVFTKKSQVNNKSGLYMDVAVKRRFRGHEKASERAQLFAPNDQEMELGKNSKGRTAGNLSISVMAHQL